MKANKEVERIIRWLKLNVEKAGARGAVFGLSGGVDSAVVAAICKKAFQKNCLGVIMPCQSSPEDVCHATQVAKGMGLPLETVVLDEVYTTLIRKLNTGKQANELVLANIKPRLRMTVLYYFGGLYNYLVIGTSNRSEILTGYFTKYGDGGVDLQPIGHLLKTEVIKMAEYLNIPEEVIKKPPSAGLFPEQTDEKEMGITYEELDSYLAGREEVPQRVRSIAKELIRKTEHKRHMPPVPTRKEELYL